MFYSFDTFCLDGSRRVLYDAGVPVSLRPRMVRALLLLVQQRGRELNKNDLMEQLWPDCVVEENNLTVIISVLRKVLGDNREHRKYIVTIPGTGYCFAADAVESESRPSSLEKQWDEDHEFETASLSRGESVHSAQMAIAGALGAKRLSAIIVLSLTFALAAWATSRWIGTQPNAINAVAVLPFESTGFGSDDDYLRLGMADALAERLHNLKHVRILPVGDSLSYKNSAYDPRAAGEALSAGAILTGTVQKAAGSIRVNARLLTVKDSTTLWSGNFDGDIREILTIQDRIAEQAAYALTHESNAQRRLRPTPTFTTDPDAYQLYIHGRYFMDRRTHYQGQESLKRAIAYLEQAVHRDPKFAAAYAGLATAYNKLNWYLPPEDSIARAEALAQKALSLDPNLPDAYRSFGFARQVYDWDLSGAVAAYRRSIELDPGESVTHRWYADALVAMGRSQEAISEARKGQELDPSSAGLDTLGHVYFFSHRYEDAFLDLQSKQDVDPNVPWYLAWLYSAHERQSRNTGLDFLGRSYANDPSVTCEVVYARALTGKDPQAEVCLRFLHKKTDISPYNIALLYAALNDSNSAFYWLDCALRAHAWELAFINVDPRVDTLRSDSRFEALLRTMHMHPN